MTSRPRSVCRVTYDQIETWKGEWGLPHPGGVEGYQRVTTWTSALEWWVESVRLKSFKKYVVSNRSKTNVFHSNIETCSQTCLKHQTSPSATRLQSLWSDFPYYSAPNQQQVLNSFEGIWTHLRSHCLIVISDTVILLWSWQKYHHRSSEAHFFLMLFYTL